MHGPIRGNALIGLSGGPGTAVAPEAGAKRVIADLNAREIAVLAPLVVLVLGIGLYPKPVLDVITPSVDATMNSVGESDLVTGGN
jgi:NADH-quinone oxidoreductase subunit M